MNGDQTTPQLTPEMWHALNAIALASGTQVAPPSGESVPGAPTLDMGKGWRVLGSELGAIIKHRNIFLRAGVLGRVHESSGEWQRFDAKNFAGWCEEFVAFKHKGEKIKLSAENAAMLMAQFTFLDQIRELRGIHRVSLPVLQADGRVRWLGRGYDSETCIFTVPEFDYAMDWSVDKAVEFLTTTFRHFPWMRAEDESAEDLHRNRSFAVHVASMVGVYCRAMFGAGTIRPMVLWVANQQGSGKTVLAQSAIAPVFGLFPGDALPKNDDELQKALASAAMAFAPFMFFDDIPFLKSNHLNRFITEPRHGGRKLGGNETFDLPAVTQIFATGNDLKGSRDIALRSMVVELFYAGDLEKRQLPAQEMDAAWLAKVETRKSFLSALCALVKHWDARVSLPDSARAMLDGIKGMPRFGTFTRTISAIVQAAYFADPLTAPLMAVDEDVDEMRNLLIALGDACEGKDRVWSRDEIVEKAREMEICEDLVGSKGDKDLDAASSKRFGYRMRAWRGRELMDTQGRRFKFSHLKKRSGITYPVAFLA